MRTGDNLFEIPFGNSLFMDDGFKQLSFFAVNFPKTIIALILIPLTANSLALSLYTNLNWITLYDPPPLLPAREIKFFASRLYARS